jgi:putative membrane protein
MMLSDLPLPAIPATAVLFTAAIYTRGWLRLRHTSPMTFPSWRVGSFLAGLCLMLLALSDPVDELADSLLIAHMTQHIFFMSVIPPLVILGSPTIPLILGSPRWLFRATGSAIRSRRLRTAFEWIAHPFSTVLLMVIAFVAWHVPVLYELALHSETWHAIEHACFFSTSLLFWWRILEFGSNSAWSPWTKVACLVAADVANTAVSAYLSFSGATIYPSYIHSSTIWGLTAIADQNAAGAGMWVVNSLAFLIPAMIIPFRALTPSLDRSRNYPPASGLLSEVDRW